MTKSKISISFVFDALALLLLGAVSVGYILDTSHFAEQHIQLSFLSFPIFIGEITIALCLVIAFFNRKLYPISFNRTEILLIIYFIFVLVKAAFGYSVYGPLALRHSAMFYYPICAVLCFKFYRKAFYGPIPCIIFISGVISLWALGLARGYWVFALMALSFAALVRVKGVYLKWVLAGLLVFVIPYELIFNTARMMIVANTFSFLGLLLVSYVMLPFRSWKKALGLIVLSALFGLGMYHYANLSAVKSIISVSQMRETFKFYNDRVLEKEADFKWKEFSEVQLYKKNNVKKVALVKQDSLVNKELLVKKESLIKENIQTHQSEPLKEVAQLKQVAEERLEADCNNGVFRLLIWRDMIVEYAKERPILGFHFGKPLRSISLEINNWAPSEWGRDGWIAAHNSFLHFLYRSGPVGCVAIVFVVGMLFYMIGSFIKLKSISGLLLCSVIGNWFVAANFLLIFELPYNAIPLWSIFGFTWAFCQELKKQDQREESATVVLEEET